MIFLNLFFIFVFCLISFALSGSWERFSSPSYVPHARHSSFFAHVEDYATNDTFLGDFFIFGGRESSWGSFLSDVIFYRIDEDKWVDCILSDDSDGPSDRYHGSTGFFGSSIVLFGGSIYNDDDTKTSYDETWILHLDSSINDNDDAENSSDDADSDNETANTVSSDDTDSNSDETTTSKSYIWNLLDVGESDRPSARAGAGNVVIGDNMYIYGGRNSNDVSNASSAEDSQYLNDMWKYNVVSNSWEEIDLDLTTQVTPGYRYGHLMFSTSFKSENNQKNIILFGGRRYYSVSEEKKGIFFNDVYLFNTTSETWECLFENVISTNVWREYDAPMPRYLSHGGIISSGNKDYMVMFGGKYWDSVNGHIDFDDLWVFSVEDSEWKIRQKGTIQEIFDSMSTSQVVSSIFEGDDHDYVTTESIDVKSLENLELVILNEIDEIKESLVLSTNSQESPSARYGAAFYTKDNYMYLFGGVHGHAEDEITVYNDFWRTDMNNYMSTMTTPILIMLIGLFAVLTGIILVIICTTRKLKSKMEYSRMWEPLALSSPN
ncbi:hypothetical protein ADUPG1_009166 [Aduncisulcus paluster]|uniref:Galactose oxidase n=1 Tax=Aduncisulcus paluster TaxID=2918883 RepID=A0ABQ5KUL9_9EUKA|nr:hypothetical protein ADUPG1_009166 [Aduncisulcus paluster]